MGRVSWAKWGNKRARNAVSGRYGQHEKWATRETGNAAQLQSAAPETWTPAGWTPLYIDKLYKRLESLVSNAIFLPCVGLFGWDLTLTLVLWLESNHWTMQFACLCLCNDPRHGKHGKRWNVKLPVTNPQQLPNGSKCLFWPIN